MDDFGSSLGSNHFQHDLNDPELLGRTVNLAELLNELRPLGSLDSRWHEYMQSLPKLNDEDVGRLGLENDATCPVCYNTLLALIAEEELGFASDSPAYTAGELGVTKLEKSCGHIFCRKDITKWIRAGGETCPMCRKPLLPPLAAADSSNSEQGAMPDLANPRALFNFMASQGFSVHMPEGFSSNSNSPFSGWSQDAGRDRVNRERDDRDDFSGMYS